MNTNLVAQPAGIEEFSKHVRFDKLFSEYGFNFIEFGNDGQLMFDLIVYFASQHQDNFFGFGDLNVDHFCKTMKYSKTNLLRSHDDPYQLQIFPEKKKEFLAIKNSSGANKDDFFYTILDNALYRLFKTKITFGDQESQLIGESKRSILKKVSLNGGIIVIEEIHKFYKKLKNTHNKATKVIYKFRLNQIFLENLTTFYLNINIDSVANLRKSNNVFLYTYFKNLEAILRAQGRNYSDTTSFDELCIKAEIGSSMSPSDQKKTLRSKCKHIFSVSDLKGEITFIQRPNDKYKFQPVIKFTNTNSMPTKGTDAYNKSIFHAAQTRFLHRLKDHFIQIGGSEQNGTFSDWFINAYDSKRNITISQPHQELMTMCKFVYSEVVGSDISIGDSRIATLMIKSYEYILDLKNRRNASNELNSK